MVQTESQYICIHQCLLTVLEGKENTSPIREIHDNQGYEGKLIDSFRFILFIVNVFRNGRSVALSEACGNDSL